MYVTPLSMVPDGFQIQESVNEFPGRLFGKGGISKGAEESGIFPPCEKLSVSDPSIQALRCCLGTL